MGLINEPLDIDFYVDPRCLTKEEGEKLVKILVNKKPKRPNEKTIQIFQKESS